MKKHYILGSVPMSELFTPGELKVLDQWVDFAKELPKVDESTYKKDILIKKINSKINRLNNRKRKKALKKIPGTLYKGCYPTSVGEITETGDGKATLEIKFESLESDTPEVIIDSGLRTMTIYPYLPTDSNQSSYGLGIEIPIKHMMKKTNG